MAHFIPCQPGTTLLYYLEGHFESEPGVAWIFNTQQPAEDGYYYPNLVGALGTERYNAGGAAVLMPDGKVYNYHTSFETVEAFRAYMEAETIVKPTPTRWAVKDIELSPALAALV